MSKSLIVMAISTGYGRPLVHASYCHLLWTSAVDTLVVASCASRSRRLLCVLCTSHVRQLWRPLCAAVDASRCCTLHFAFAPLVCVSCRGECDCSLSISLYLSLSLSLRALHCFKTKIMISNYQSRFHDQQQLLEINNGLAAAIVSRTMDSQERERTQTLRMSNLLKWRNILLSSNVLKLKA